MFKPFFQPSTGLQSFVFRKFCILTVFLSDWPDSNHNFTCHERTHTCTRVFQSLWLFIWPRKKPPYSPLFWNFIIIIQILLIYVSSAKKNASLQKSKIFPSFDENEYYSHDFMSLAWMYKVINSVLFIFLFKLNSMVLGCYNLFFFILSKPTCNLQLLFT